ncbi:MAG: hypothetical protein JSS31_05165 [Proteobacteria bacterium]|nr:hypothetical protein [Pseudomonadota bacterium]MBS0493340.1 hypothetical protein [Pseudomonadota bacterium]
MTTPPKTPPRFVPTLTDVVHLPDTPRRFVGAASHPSQEAASAAAAVDSAPQALRFKPVHDSESGARRDFPGGIEEHVVHRVMQRVDLVLDQRLREAIAQVIQEQTRSMVPRLREEVESVVRHAVYEAVADELAGNAL